MNGIIHGLGIASTPAATSLAHERRGDVPQAEIRHGDATLLTLTSGGAGKSAQPAPGLAALYALLQGLDDAALAQLPPRTAHLLAELGRHLLPAPDAGNGKRLRTLVLHSGLFLEAEPANDGDDGACSSAPLDLKNLLGQLLALLQPGRRLTLHEGHLQFASLNPGTAQCLQAYAEEQKHGSRDKRLLARLLANVESAFLGIVRNQLQSLALSSGKKTRWIMDLVLQHESGPVSLPLTLAYEGQELPERWEAEFELGLRHCGALHVVLGVKSTTVSVSIVASGDASLELLRGGKPLLAQILGRKGLALGSYACQRGQHERLAG